MRTRTRPGRRLTLAAAARPGAGDRAADARPEPRGRVAEREPGLGDQDRDQRRGGFPLRGQPGRHAALRSVPGAARHHRATRRRSRLQWLDRGRLQLRFRYPGRRQRGDRSGEAPVDVALSRAVPGHPERSLRRGRIQPASTVWPCTGGNCSNWVSFLDAVVGAIKASGVTVAYDIWNEPDETEFWTPGMDSTQYFQMWDTAVQTIRSLDPGAITLGPSLPPPPGRTPASGRRGSRTPRQPGHSPARSPITSRATVTIP